MLASLFFVVIGLIQFSCVLHLHQCNEKNQTKLEGPQEEETNMTNLLAKESIRIQFYQRNAMIDTKKIDNAAFYITGSLFLIFNSLYWTIFLLFWRNSINEWNHLCINYKCTLSRVYLQCILTLLNISGIPW